VIGASLPGRSAPCSAVARWRNSEPPCQGWTNDRYSVFCVEPFHRIVVALRGDLLELTEVAVEADTWSQQVHRPACTLVGMSVGEAVLDARRGRGEVARSKLYNVVSQLDCQYAFQNEEGVFLFGVEVQGRPSPISEMLYDHEIKSSLVIATIRFPRPAWRVPQHIPFHGPAFPGYQRLSGKW